MKDTLRAIHRFKTQDGKLDDSKKEQWIKLRAYLATDTLTKNAKTQEDEHHDLQIMKLWMTLPDTKTWTTNLTDDMQQFQTDPLQLIATKLFDETFLTILPQDFATDEKEELIGILKNTLLNIGKCIENLNLAVRTHTFPGQWNRTTMTEALKSINTLIQALLVPRSGSKGVYKLTDENKIALQHHVLLQWMMTNDDRRKAVQAYITHTSPSSE